jgi:hypothetical protein
MVLPASVTFEEKAKAANRATQMANGTHGFNERPRTTCGLYQIITAAMALKMSTPVPTYPKPSYCPGPTGKAGKNSDPAGFTKVSKSAE